MPWISTFSGGRFDFANLNSHDVYIEDIAHALALQNRFNGHSKFPYSVAQHSILCSLYIAPQFALEALLHDATEAYMPDLSSPLKRLLPEFKQLENEVWIKAIAPAFNLPAKESPEVKFIDRQMVVTEAKQLIYNCQWWKEAHWPEPLNITIEQWNWRTAEIKFVSRFRELYNA